MRHGPLKSWQELNKQIKKLGERQLHMLLSEERAGAKRPTFLTRIYGRFSKVRELRERRELLK